MCRVHQVKCQAGWSTSWNQDFQEKYQSPQMSRVGLLMAYSLNFLSTENVLISPSFLKCSFSEYITHSCQLEKKILHLKNMPISPGYHGSKWGIHCILSLCYHLFLWLVLRLCKIIFNFWKFNYNILWHGFVCVFLFGIHLSFIWN